MNEIQKEIQEKLCKLLENAGKQILYSKESTMKDRLDCYEKILQKMLQINENIDYIIAEINNF